VSTLPNPPYTRAEDLTVLEVKTPSFSGAIAVVGIQACFGSGHESEVVPGIRVFDVTHANRPTLLGQWDLPKATIGCHEVDAVQRADGRVLAVCARNLVDHENSGGTTSIHLLDITEPAHPRVTANWTERLAPDSGVGCSPNQFTHSARFEDGGRSLYVSYWDAGTVHLNIADPASSAIVSQTKVGVLPEGDGKTWDGDSGLHWAEHQDRYDAMLSRLTPGLITAVGLSAADRVLDVGCGCGETTRIAGRLVPDGTALGVDLSGPMLGRARARAEVEGLSNVRFDKADAQVTAFPVETFDRVLSRFGVMFFDDPQAAFANLGRSIRPGGRITFLCWQEVGRNEHFAVPYGAVAAIVSPPDLGEPGAPGPFSLADPARIRHLLGEAGFCDVEIQAVTEPVRMGADAEDAIQFLQATPAARAMLGQADEETSAKARAALRDALTPYETSDGLFLGSAAWLVTAHRA
jgi:SAM-dependent methyltransferase